MAPQTTLAWLRLDLRLEDNPALHAAAADGGEVVPVFVWAPAEEAPWEPGAASRWWLHHSLARLGAALESRGSRLIIARGPSREALLRVAAETGATGVYWNRRYEPAAIARDIAAKEALRAAGLDAKSFNAALLQEPWEIRNQSGQPFRVFTAYWKACLRADEPPEPLGLPARLAAPATWPESRPLSELKLLPATDWAAGFRDAWNPGEAGAQAAMGRLLEARAAGYAEGRDTLAEDGTSRLSPALHFGEIGPRQLWHALHRARGTRNRDAAARAGEDAFLRQLYWREFAHHLLFHFPATTQHPLRPEFERFPWRAAPAELRAWQQGRTGYPAVDAGMRQLWATGWMHNRARLLAASFLTKHLLLPWQEGARWFWDTLVDADLANNTLGWQWVAGCGADAAPYFRIFNPALQATRFDPGGAYVRRWVPEAGTAGYVPPIVAHDAARARALEAYAEIRKR